MVKRTIETKMSSEMDLVIKKQQQEMENEIWALTGMRIPDMTKDEESINSVVIELTLYRDSDD